jgi:hypothetical protein
MSMEIGGGVTNFMDSRLRDITSVGGNWTARLQLGTRSYVALELAYVGSAQNMNGLGLNNGASLIGNGADGDIRINILPRFQFTPYVFGGVGWRHYSVNGTTFFDTNVSPHDNVLEVPVGAGVAYRYMGFVADARFDYRPTFETGLFNNVKGFSNIEMTNWNVTARIGWEF